MSRTTKYGQQRIIEQLQDLIQKALDTDRGLVRAVDRRLQDATLQDAHELAAYVDRQADYLQQALNSHLQLKRRVDLLRRILDKDRKYDDEQLNQRLEEIQSLASKKDPEARQKWELLFAQALVDWRLDICQLIVTGFAEREDVVEDTSLYENAIEQFETRQYGDEAQSVLQKLIGSLGNNGADRNETLALLHILIGNLYALETSGQYASQRKEHYQEAERLLPKDCRVRAGLGYFFHDNAQRKATRHFKEAVNVAPDQPEGYVGLGSLDEADEWWDEARKWYQKAIQAIDLVPDKVNYLGRLLAPVSGNLYFELARWLHEDGDLEQALEACRLAFSLGVRGESRYPERELYELQGSALAGLERWPEAAEAYHQAGKRFYWLEEYGPAIDSLRKADSYFDKAEIDGEARLANYVYWADTLYMDSHLKVPPYVDATKLEQAQEKWRQAITLDEPVSEWLSWTFNTRGRIANRRSQLTRETYLLYGEAVAYAERALLYRPNDRIRWADASWHLRSSGLSLSALAAARRANELAKADENAPADYYSMEMLAGSQINVGLYDEAHATLDVLISETPHTPFFMNWRALTFWLQEDFAASLQIAEEAFVEVEHDIWQRGVRGDIYRLAGEWPKARADYQWIWARADDDNYQSTAVSTFGRVAFHFGLHGESGSDRYMDEAKILLEEALARQDSDFTDHVNLAIHHLVTGTVTAAVDIIREAIAQVTVARYLDYSRIELNYVKGYLQDQGQLSDSQLEGFRSCLEMIGVASEELRRHPPNRFDELKQFLERVPDGSSGWVAGTAVLARTYVEHLNLERARYYYEQLVSSRADDDLLNLTWANKEVLTQAEALQQSLIPLRDDANSELTQLVTPIAIELTSNLIPADPDDWHLITKYPEILRRFVNREAGFALPGLRFRDAGDGAAERDWTRPFREQPLEEYRILVREVPRAKGRIHPNGYFCPVSEDEVERLGVPAEEIVPAKHPTTGRPGCWVSRKYVDLLRQQELEIWEDPLWFIMIHIEAIFRQNMIAFLDMQQIEAWFTQWKETPTVSELAEKWWFSAPAGVKIQLARLLRAMAREQLSLVDGATILNVVDENGLSIPLHEITGLVRRKLTKLVPISAVWQATTVTTPASIEASILQETQADHEEAVIVSEENASQLLPALRPLLDSSEMAQILLVQDERARPYVRYLTESEFPALLVMTEAEWKSAHSDVDSGPLPFLAELAEVTKELPETAVFPTSIEPEPLAAPQADSDEVAKLLQPFSEQVGLTIGQFMSYIDPLRQLMKELTPEQSSQTLQSLPNFIEAFKALSTDPGAEEPIERLAAASNLPTELVASILKQMGELSDAFASEQAKDPAANETAEADSSDDTVLPKWVKSEDEDDESDTASWSMRLQ